MTITVTENDIEQARIYGLCPVELALQRQGIDAEIDDGEIEITRFVETPAEVLSFLDKFENDEEVKPFSFDLPME